MKQLSNSHFDVLPATDDILREAPLSVQDRPDPNGTRLSRRFDETPSGVDSNPVVGFMGTLEPENRADFLDGKMSKRDEFTMFGVVAKNYGIGTKQAPSTAPSLLAATSQTMKTLRLN